MINGHGDNIYDYGGKVLHNFSSNVFPAMQPAGLVDCVRNAAGRIGNYPPANLSRQEKRLAAVLGVEPEHLMVTNGATEAIYLVASVADDSDHFIIQPTFSEYEDALTVNGRRCHLLSDFREARFRYGTLWMCNPNNPTGTTVDADDIRQWRIRYNGWMVLDQSYDFFTMQQTVSAAEAAAMDNTILINSMTKRFAIPGLRLGYIICGDNNMMKKIRSKCIPWRINTLSLAALDYLIEHWYDTASAASMMMAETRRLHAMLNSIPGITALPTATHFFLVNIGLADCHELSAKLMSRYGILVRCADNFRGLDNHFIRISTQTPEENDILVKAIEECISQ